MKRLSRNSEQSQFLIGKVERNAKYADKEVIPSLQKSQFLIGKVELKFFKKIEELWPSDHVSIPYR